MILENQAQCHIVLGADHPLTLRHINNHAANCEAQGNLRKAELLYKQCLVKRRLSQGATHPETLSSSNNLACLYVKQLQQLKEAERMFKECLKERQRIVGLRHPDTLSTINNIATLYWRTDKADLAHDVYIDCTEECVEQLGRAHPVAAAALENLQELVTQLQQLNGTNLELEDHHQQQQQEQEQEQQGEEEERPAEEKPLSIQTSPNPSPKAKKHRHHRYEHASSGEDHGQHRRSRRKK